MSGKNKLALTAQNIDCPKLGLIKLILFFIIPIWEILNRKKNIPSRIGKTKIKTKTNLPSLGLLKSKVGILISI